MPPSLPAYTTFASVGLKAMACWSGWTESPVGVLALIFDQSHVPDGLRTPRWMLTAPRYTTSALFGATARYQSYHDCPVSSKTGTSNSLNAPPNVERRHTLATGSSGGSPVPG